MFLTFLLTNIFMVNLLVQVLNSSLSLQLLSKLAQEEVPVKFGMKGQYFVAKKGISRLKGWDLSWSEKQTRYQVITRCFVKIYRWYSITDGKPF